MADAPYVVQKGSLTSWQFTLTYATVDQFLVMAHEQLGASRLPYADRKEALQVIDVARLPIAVSSVIAYLSVMYGGSHALCLLSICPTRCGFSIYCSMNSCMPRHKTYVTVTVEQSHVPPCSI